MKLPSPHRSPWPLAVLAIVAVLAFREAVVVSREPAPQGAPRTLADAQYFAGTVHDVRWLRRTKYERPQWSVRIGAGAARLDLREHDREQGALLARRLEAGDSVQAWYGWRAPQEYGPIWELRRGTDTLLSLPVRRATFDDALRRLRPRWLMPAIIGALCAGGVALLLWFRLRVWTGAPLPRSELEKWTDPQSELVGRIVLAAMGVFIMLPAHGAELNGSWGFVLFGMLFLGAAWPWGADRVRIRRPLLVVALRDDGLETEWPVQRVVPYAAITAARSSPPQSPLQLLLTLGDLAPEVASHPEISLTWKSTADAARFIVALEQRLQRRLEIANRVLRAAVEVERGLPPGPDGTV